MSGHRIRLVALAVIALACTMGRAEEPVPKESVLLMSMLSEWLYPGCKFHGAESSDAAVADVSSIKNQALLTTSDTVEQVMTFYQVKLNVDATGKNLGDEGGRRTTTKRSVLIQNVSKGRPLELYIIDINEPDASTTLTISRGDGEKTTHITWSNYRKL